MKKLSKILPVFFSFIFVISSFMSITAFAAVSGSNDVSATLTFDKEEYEYGEEIKGTLTVLNQNAYPITVLQTKLEISSGLSLESGNLIQNEFILEKEQSKSQDFTLIKRNSPSNEIVPNDTDDSSFNNSDVPYTYDSFDLMFYLTLMILSGSALCYMGLKHKKLYMKELMVALLCFTFTENILEISVNAAAQTESFTVEETIKVNGQDTVVKATISYRYGEYQAVAVDEETLGYYKAGDTVTVTANEPEGYHFVSWLVKQGNIELEDASLSTTTFKMGEDAVEIEAQYEINTYIIHSGINLSVENISSFPISPKEVSVEYNQDITFTITKPSEYRIKAILIDDQPIDVDTEVVEENDIYSYTFHNVKASHTIYVNFVKDCIDPNCASCEENCIICTVCAEGYIVNELGTCDKKETEGESGTCETCSESE